MKLLFMKHTLAWPRSSGHDVHTFYMMQACADLGHEVCFATVAEPCAEALEGLALTARIRLDGVGAPQTQHAAPGTPLQRRFRGYWGVSEMRIAALRRAAHDLHVDAVIVVGLDVLPYLPGLADVVRVWYAADEWVLHHLSQVRIGSATIGADLRAAVVKGLYEWAHRRVVDRVWVVSEADRSAARWIAGMIHVDVLPNGVDSRFFAPGPEVQQPRTAVFWGRLDFGPNVQALDWFCKRVWPLVRREAPDGRFTIIGFQPTDPIRRLVDIEGISLEPDLPDLRPAVRRQAVAVLPFVSGAGIKNKLLEAAAMGLPIVCTSRTARALRGDPPLVRAESAEQFARALVSLWADAERRRTMGAAARAWVLAHHTWESVAREAMSGLRDSVALRPRGTMRTA
jgi:glycosyltransferase involved in cell wall biosynthesis